MNKKRMLLILFILFISMFSFCDNVYAKKYYVEFDVSVFSKEADWVYFKDQICNEPSGGDRCSYLCDGAGGFNSSSCSPYTDTKKFRINPPRGYSTQEIANQSNMEIIDGLGLMTFVKEKYCSKKSSDSFCKYISSNETKTIETKNGDFFCPTANVKLHGNNCSYSSIQFKIQYHNSDQTTNFNYVNTDLNAQLIGDTATICDNQFFLHGKNGNNKDFSKTLKDKYKSNDCPSILWCSSGEKENGYYNWYAEFSETCNKDDYGENAISQSIDSSGESSDIHLDYATEETSHVGELINKDNVSEITTCERLFSGDGNSQELMDMIRNIWTAVKIFVPIALIVLGTIDFAKAVLAQDETNMKKAQGVFIKRIIIAVAIFVVPSVLKMLLRIGHIAWPGIISEELSNLCGLIQ